MATGSGKDKTINFTRIYVGGYDLSGDARTFSSLEGSLIEADVTGWSDGVRNFVKDGRLGVGVRGFQALVNDTTGQSFARLKDAPDADVSIVFGGGGVPAIPDPAYIIAAVQLMDTTIIDGNVAVIQADFVPESGVANTAVGNPFGVLLSPATSISATTTNTSSDYGAATANGWHAILHLLATSSGNFALTIEHSSDDSSFATLGTFTSTGGSVASEYLSGSGSVNRYVRFVATRTAGTITPVVTFARG